MRRSLALAAAAFWATMGVATVQAAPPQRFIVYYGSQNDPALAQYDTLVFDADSHPALAPLLKPGKTVLGYISLGEAEQNRSYYKQLKDAGILKAKNENWPDSRFIDIRDPRWTDLVVGQLVPQILAQGFTGLFLDTLDDPADLERRDPKRFKGMTAAAVALVKRIRQANPAIPIMLNRGYEILPQVAPDITMVLAESLVSDYDFQTRRYRMNDPADTDTQRSLLKRVKAEHPGLALYSLDYWQPPDRPGIDRIYEQERAAGFIPYVATVDLSRIMIHP